MNKPNIQRIAEQAGVSTATVSYVINNKPGVSEATRERIRGIIEREDYTPNVNSRRLAMKRSFNIVLAIDNDSPLDNIFYSSILNEITAVGAEFGYSIVLHNMSGNNAKTAVNEVAKQGNADGFIFMHDIDNDTHQIINRTGCPFVIIDSHLKSPTYPAVRIDYEIATYTVTRYLIEQGHKDIAFVAMSRIPEFYLATFNGLMRAFSQSGISIYPPWIQADAYDMESAFKCMQEILRTPKQPTAVVCSGDIFALACINCTQSVGLNVPKDISFVSIDDLYISSFYYPSLTTLRINLQEMAKRAVMLLNEQLEGKVNASNIVHTLRSDDLVIRSSVARRVLPEDSTD